MIKKYLVDNLDKGIHKVKCKFEHHKRCGFCGMKTRNCECCFEYSTLKNDLILYKCSCCKRSNQKNLNKRFANTYNFFKFFNRHKFFRKMCLEISEPMPAHLFLH